jgi:hypothetical protein
VSSKVVAVTALPINLPEGQSELVVQINEPGIVRSVTWCLEKRLVMTRGNAQFDEVLTMFIEVSPTGPRRTRRFAVLPTDKKMSVPDGYALEYLGTAASGNTGQVAHLYEVKAVS